VPPTALPPLMEPPTLDPALPLALTLPPLVAPAAPGLGSAGELQAVAAAKQPIRVEQAQREDSR
jgi:hypothetical protein